MSAGAGFEQRRAWVREAIRRIEADFQRSSDTHLIPLPLPGFAGHRPVPEGRIQPPHRQPEAPAGAQPVPATRCATAGCTKARTVVEASSGSTAVSEAYFARLLGLPFVAVMPRSTSPQKIAAIEFHGGRCHLVERPDARCTPKASAWPTNAAATTWTSSPTPSAPPTGAPTTTSPRASTSRCSASGIRCRRWIVASAGTGGTLATIGRYVRYCRHDTRVCGVDAEHSVFFDHYVSGDADADAASAARASKASAGRAWKPRSCPACWTRWSRCPTSGAWARCMRLSVRLGRRVGASTGTNLVAALACAQSLKARGAARLDRHAAVRRRPALPPQLLRRRLAARATTWNAKRRAMRSTR